MNSSPELLESLAELAAPPNCKSIPPNWTSRFDKVSPPPAPGISTALLGILEGAGILALGSAALPRSLDPLETGAGLMGLNAEPGVAELKFD